MITADIILPWALLAVGMPFSFLFTSWRTATFVLLATTTCGSLAAWLLPKWL